MLIVFIEAQHHCAESSYSVLLYCDTFIQGLSSQLEEDVDRLKSELSDEKEKQILMEKSFSEREKHHKASISFLQH